MSASSQIAVRHFGRAAVIALRRKGILIKGTCLVQTDRPTHPFIGCTPGYFIIDNGCGRIWTYAQVTAAAQ